MFNNIKIYLMLAAAGAVLSVGYFGWQHYASINAQLASVTESRNMMQAENGMLKRQQADMLQQQANLQTETRNLDKKRAALERKLNALDIAKNFDAWAESDLDKLRGSMRNATAARLRAVVNAANSAGAQPDNVPATTGAAAGS